MSKVVKPELLAPAGNLEKLKVALNYGADAVYIGGIDYSLRANATNFTIDDIKKGVEFAHNLNKKVYVTVNVIFHNEDFIGLKDYLKILYELNVDAIIISDLSLIDICRDIVPNLKIHISTQMSTLNYKAVSFLEHLGVERVVLGREASKSDIKLIKDKTNVELETFINGAMCVGFSGRCVLSNYLTNRDSNRGGCSQICRFTFDLYTLEKRKVNTPLKFQMCSKDLSMLKYIDEMIKLGIRSFKIEGRMRSNYYIATVVNMYRKIIDDYFDGKYEYNPQNETLLRQVSNREAVVHYFDKSPSVNEQYYQGREEKSNQDFLGVVIGYNKKTKEMMISQRNYFKIGDEVEVFGPNTNLFSFKIKSIKNDLHEEIEVARHPEEILIIPVDKKVEIDDMLRKKN